MRLFLLLLLNFCFTLTELNDGFFNHLICNTSIDTLFDALIRAGKKPAIVAETNSSMSKIYLERDMDYYFFDTIAEWGRAEGCTDAVKYMFLGLAGGNFLFELGTNLILSPAIIRVLKLIKK